MADSTTSSFWTKKRGACSRSSRFFEVMTSALPSPTRVPLPMAQTRIFQVVRFSGSGSGITAVPSASVASAATQTAVSANSLRTTGCTSAGPPPPMPPPPIPPKLPADPASKAMTAPGAGMPPAGPIAAPAIGAAAVMAIPSMAISPPMPPAGASMPFAIMAPRRRGIPPLPPNPMAGPSASSASPNRPTVCIGVSRGLSRLPNQRDSVCIVLSLCCRRHCQKWARMSPTFEPPATYSTLLS